MLMRIAGGLAMLTLVASGPAQAWTGKVSWPTFYRAGPGRNFTVLDEIDRGATLEVLSCKGGWCQVRNGRNTGYVEQEWIIQPAALAEKPTTPGADGCVQSIVTGSGYTGGLDYRFCPRGAQAGVPSGQPAPGSGEPATDWLASVPRDR